MQGLRTLFLFALLAVGTALGEVETEKEKLLGEIASYVNMLHQTKKFYTIYTLFDVSERSSKGEVKEKYAKLIRRYRLLKKDEIGPLGKEIDRQTALNLINTGYRIITDEKYKRLYDWVVNEAPPNFIDFISRKQKKGRHVPVSAPGPVTWLVFLFLAFFLFDLLSTVLPHYLERAKREASPRREKGLWKEEKGGYKGRKPPQEKPAPAKLGLGDMRTFKILRYVQRRLFSK